MFISQDVSIRNNHSVIQWIVTNIEGDIAGGDEVMEYVTPVAWRWVRGGNHMTDLIEIRNCFGGTTNHGDVCTGEGVVYEPDYVHRNVLYVFRWDGMSLDMLDL